MSELGDVIQQIRRRRGETMVEFAKLLGCRHSAVSRYEAGKLHPSRSMLILLLQFAQGEERSQILRVLGVDEDLQEGWNKGEIEGILVEFEQYLAAGGNGVKIPSAGNAIVEFAGEALGILSARMPVSPALVEVLRKWRRHGDDPSAHQYFEHIAIYLEVELKRFESVVRKGASKVAPKGKGKK